MYLCAPLERYAVKTKIKDFGRRLQRDVNKLINNRIKMAAELSNAAIKPEPMKVEVSFSFLTSISFKFFISAAGGPYVEANY